MQTIKVLESSDPKQFEIDVNDCLKEGYRISSTSCGFVDDSKYDYCGSYQAVLVCEIKEEKILRGRLEYSSAQ